jgi:heme oxygenase
MSVFLSQETAPPFSSTLRERTCKAHTEAEHSTYMTALVGGRVTTIGLAALLSRLLPVYETLEVAAERWIDDPRIGQFVRSELHRTARLRADLEHLTGCVDVPVTPASVAYAARVEQVGRSSGPAFVAHHYTRYLGDLSGGQVIRVALERNLGVADGSGASFFAFPGVRGGALKQQYRNWLDETPFTHAEREELIEEALVAYRLNIDIGRELDADLQLWRSA